MEFPISVSLDELTFYLFDRPLHPELFNIYASRRFFQGDYEVIIWVTGCSHVVSVFSEGQCLSELICSPEQLLPRLGRREAFRFHGQRNHQCQWGRRFNYSMSFQTEQMSSNLFRSTHRDLTTAAKKRGLFVSFPQLARNDLAPFSYLDYEARCNELQVYAFHAFPEQSTVIKSQSLFNLP